MTHDDIRRLYKISQELGVHIHALTPTSCITPVMNPYSEIESTINGIPLDIVDFNNLDPDTIIVKIMMVDDPEILSAAIEKLPEELYTDYTVVRSAPIFLEFLDKKVNKGVGVKLLADSLGIKAEEVICIGDADNDLHMIEYAGLGVAMGNAFTNVKKAANYVTYTNENDGVAHVIERFILSDEFAS